MCCILCEEPVRSIAFGLAAVGIVTVVNGARQFLARGAQSQEPMRIADGASATAAIVGDVAS